MRGWSDRALPAGIAGIALVVCATVAVAQQSSGEGRVLHEYFDPSIVDETGEAGPTRASGIPEESASDSAGPPGLTLDPEEGDVVLGPDGPVDQKSRRAPYGPSAPGRGGAELDGKTDRVDNLDYNSSFDPSVFPYKRNVSQNRARRTADGRYQFRTEPGELERVGARSGARPNEDTFWGTFLIRAESGERHPIPSVSPDQRVVSVRTEPSTEATLYRDAAGNFYASFDYDGLVRLNVEVAVPRFYFRGEFRGNVDWSDFAPERGPDLDADIREVAGHVASQIGVGRRMRPARVLQKLVYYYRNFETKALPRAARDGDLYQVISRRQIGVCRHRSMGFVLTARHLGIPARYVTNEAHAFVEVWWPAGGWRRIDLGGAARDISYNGRSEDRLHNGAERDPLPQPPAYRDALRRLRERQQKGGSGGGSGAGGSGDGPGAEANSERGSEREGERTPSDDRQERRANRQRRGRSSPDAGSGLTDRLLEGRGGPDAGRRAGPSGREGRTGREERRARRNEERRARRNEEPRRGRERGDSSPPESGAGQSGTRLTLRTETREVFRGGEVVLQGTLYSRAGSPLGGMPVSVYFGRVGAALDQMEKLKTVRTDAGGRYRVVVTVPETTGIGRWSLQAVFEGNDEYGRARAE